MQLLDKVCIGHHLGRRARFETNVLCLELAWTEGSQPNYRWSEKDEAKLWGDMSE